MPYYFYIARCADNSLYIGSSDDPNRRIIEHNSGIGAQWIRHHGNAKIVYTEEYPTYLEAHRRELQVKKWSRKKQENLIQGRLFDKLKTGKPYFLGQIKSIALEFATLPHPKR